MDELPFRNFMGFSTTSIPQLRKLKDEPGQIVEKSNQGDEVIPIDCYMGKFR